jgi:uncharacterized protein YndB with AHSA1/START domain
VTGARASLEINASVDDVWELLSRFQHWPRWGPTVADVESDAVAVGPGVTGRVKTFAGWWLPFEITKVDPGRSWDWKVVGIPMTGHSVMDRGDGRSAVEFTAPIVLAPYAIVLRKGLRRLKRLAESGAEPT